jgi:hypothetical protein
MSGCYDTNPKPISSPEQIEKCISLSMTIIETLELYCKISNIVRIERLENERAKLVRGMSELRERIVKITKSLVKQIE